MWYGLKENGKLVAVSYFDHFPDVRDFKLKRKAGGGYNVVVVRVREVCSIE